MKLRNFYFAPVFALSLVACEENHSHFTATIDENIPFEASFCQSQKNQSQGCLVYATQGKIRFDLNIPSYWQEGTYHFWPYPTFYESSFKYTPDTGFPHRHYYGHMGSIHLINAAEDWVTGSFIFWVVNSLNPNDSIRIWGEFDQVPFK